MPNLKYKVQEYTRPLLRFIKVCNTLLDPGVKLRIVKGHKYFKIIRIGHPSTRAYCYIDRTNGDVYKADHKYPAQGQIRGNIYSDVDPLTYMTKDGTVHGKHGIPKGYKYRGIHTREKKVPYEFIPLDQRPPRVYKPKKRYRFKYHLRPVIKVMKHKGVAVRLVNPDFLLD